MLLSEIKKSQAFVYKNIWYVKTRQGRGQIVQASDYYRQLGELNAEPKSWREFKVDTKEWGNPEVSALSDPGPSPITNPQED